MSLAILDPFSEFVDGNRRLDPNWYEWLKELAESQADIDPTIETRITALENQMTVVQAKLALVRETLTANRDYYVSTTGNDNNDGLSPATAFKTINYGIGFPYNKLDLAGHNVNVNVANGTYNESVVINSPQVGIGVISLVGNNVTPDSVIINTPTNVCIHVSNNANLFVTGFRLQAPTGYGIISDYGGTVFGCTAMSFATCGSGHMIAGVNGMIELINFTRYFITGSAPTHAFASAHGTMRIAFGNIVIPAAQAFSAGFAICNEASYFLSAGISFTGAGVAGTTGPRFNVDGLSLMTVGANPNYWPGSIAGTQTNGGLYK